MLPLMTEIPTNVRAASPGPLVSIVTPAFNQAPFLRETLESVLTQAYEPIEYIVIDDGSTDGTADVIRSEPRLTVALSQKNMGQSLTLNKGWSIARGKYIGYLSADDVIHPQAVARLVELLESDDGIVCAFPDSDLIDISSRVIKRKVCRPFDLQELVVRQECFIGPGALFRREAFEAVGGWDPSLRLAPDREFWIRLARCGRIEFHPEVLAGYRLHQASISYKDVSEEVSREYLRVLDRYFSGELGEPDPAVLRRRDEAYAFATLLVARNSLRNMRIARGLELYREACALHPPLGGPRTKLTLLRNVLSKPFRSTVAMLRPLPKSR